MSYKQCLSVSKAENIHYNNSTSELEADNIQDAIDELSDKNVSSNKVNFDNSGTDLSSDNIQDTVVEVNTKTNTNSTTISTVSESVNTLSQSIGTISQEIIDINNTTNSLDENKQNVIPTYTQEEYELVKDSIPVGSLFNIIDDNDGSYFAKKVSFISKILYIDSHPVMLLDNTDVYINYDSVEAEDIRNGSQAHPYNSMEEAKKFLPTNLNGYSLNLYITGNSFIQNKKVVNINNFLNGVVFFNTYNNPTFYQISINYCTRVLINSDINVDFSTNTTSWTKAISIYCSFVHLLSNKKLNIIATNSNFVAGIEIGVNSLLVFDGESECNISNCYYALKAYFGNVQIRGKLLGTNNHTAYAIWNSVIRLTSDTNYTKIGYSVQSETFAGGQLYTTGIW